MRYFAVLITCLAFLSMFSVGCRRDIQLDEDPDAQLMFSQDTIVFDTVFTTVGSTSRVFKVHNTSSKAVNISSIELAGGAASPFRINVDGNPSLFVADVLLRGGDSMFVFVDVTLDPNNQTNPLMIEDSIIFMTNGNRQKVVLNAVGQDAYFHYYETSICGETWLNDKPHVVFGWVIVPSCCTLNIPAGCDVYLHKNAVIAADSCATLRITGSATDPVTFQGDRLEPEYAEEPGQWGYIWCSANSKDNVIDWAVIKNGNVGVVCDSTFTGSTNPTLRISNTIIRNMAIAGVFSRTSDIQGDNLLVTNCQQYCAAVAYGGKALFRHCTFANYWNISGRTTPAVVVNNWYKIDDFTFEIRDLTQCDFQNCIIYGDKDNELALDSMTTNGELYNCLFQMCLIKTDEPTGSFTHFDPFTQNLVNQNPLFATDYHLSSTSPVRDIALVAPAAAVNSGFDLENYSRFLDTGPDLGCYEYH